MANRDLVVRFIGDDRSLNQAFSRSTRNAKQFETRTSKVGAGLTRAFGAAGITLGASAGIAASKRFIDAATDLNEQLARSRQIFDESAASVEKWSEGLASSFGIAQAQALQFAGTFGLLFRNLGSTAPEAEAFSRQLVELAADMASFNNTDVDTALNALRSGLTGEIEPLRKFGVFLLEAETRQKALADTGKKSAEALTTQDKVLARLNIIMEQTTRTQGDFARTADGLANKQRIAAAEAANLAASIGTLLSPAMEIATVSTIALVGSLNDLIAGMGDLRTALRDSDIFDGFNEAVEEANRRASGFFENLRDNIPLLNEVARLRNAVVDGGTSFAIPSRPEEGRGAFDAATGEARQTEKNAKKAKADLERARSAFDGFLKGLGLKLDRAGLTASLNDDLAVLREIERAIKKRIRAEGRTFDLVHQLTDAQLQIAGKVEQQQADAQARQDDAVARAAEKRQKALEKRQERIERETERRRRQAQRRQREQFKALGLTSEGDKRTPSEGALLRRTRSLTEQVKGTALDTDKTQRQLRQIVGVLTDKYKTAGKEIRSAILGMLNDISSALEDKESKFSGEITKGGIRSTQRLLRGLDLTDEERRIIQQRNLGVAGRRGFSAFGVGLGTTNQSVGSIDRAGGAFVIQHLTVVSNDPNDMMKKLQKKARRSSGGRRGRHGGANLGMQ